MKPTLLIAAFVLASASAASAQITPGQWEIASTIDAIEGAAIPPAVAKMMTGKTITVKTCVTPEQAKQGPQDMLKGDKTCSVAKYTMSGGRYNSEVICRQGGMTIVTTGSGQFTPTSFSGRGRAVMTGGANMVQSQTVAGKRIGDCK